MLSGDDSNPFVIFHRCPTFLPAISVPVVFPSSVSEPIRINVETKPENTLDEIKQHDK